MLTWDAEIKPTLQMPQTSGLFSSHSEETTLSSVRISVCPRRIHAADKCFTAGKTNPNQISQTVAKPKRAKAVCSPEFMVLGINPNTMNRFMLSNTHEVLFVN